MGLGMDLLASTFDVESVVFLKRGSHFLAFRLCSYGLGDGLGDGLVGVNFRCRKCGIPSKNSQVTNVRFLLDR